MKHLLPILLTLLLLSSCVNQSGTNNNKQLETNTCICENDFCDYCVEVVSISDGDTFRGLTKDNEEIKFRIYGIDAPEKHQAFGNKSQQYLSSLIFRKTVGIKVQSTDHFDRQVVWVYTPDKKNVAAEMLKAGMAWHFKKYDKSKEYAALEVEARLRRLGLWIDKNPIAPWNFRRNNPRR